MKKVYYVSMDVLSRIRTWYVNYGFLLFGILLINIGVLNWYLWTKKNTSPVSDTRTEVVQQDSMDQNECDADCINKIVDTKLKLLPTPVTVVPQVGSTEVTPTPTAKVYKVAPTPTPTERTEYVSLTDGTLSMSSDWVSMSSSKWIDTSLYGQLVSASWEGVVQIPGGSGTVWVRLYDATNARAVDGSEISKTDTVTTSFYSGNISLWRGQNQYFIQVKSTGGGEVNVTGARIKLVVR